MRKVPIIGAAMVCLIAFLLWQQTPTSEELKLSDFPEIFKENTVVGEKTSEIERKIVENIAKYLQE